MIKDLAMSTALQFAYMTLEDMAQFTTEEQDMEYCILLQKLLNDYFNVVIQDAEPQIEQILGAD